MSELWRRSGLLVSSLFGACQLLAQQDPCSREQLEKAIDRILTIRHVGTIYFSDAAADGSIVMTLPRYRNTRPELIPILKCESLAAPVLVAHLDDTRLTAAKFEGGAYRSPIRVPLGFVCLDLLLAGLSPFGSTVRDPETENSDGLGMGFRQEFYFRPDSYKINSRGYQPLPVVREVKKAWERALAQGTLQFKYEHWKTATK